MYKPRKGLIFLGKGVDMDRLAVFVDAGYFFAAGGEAAYGTKQRSKLDFPNPRKCVDAIVSRAAVLSGNNDLLRVYWYDAVTKMIPTTVQSTIAYLHGVKLHLGMINSAGQQKGVDSLIVTDVIDLARNRAIADAVLVAGDEDLRIAVQVAQAYGVRVHILAAGKSGNNVSPSLQMEADSVDSLDAEWFREHLALVPSDRAEYLCKSEPQVASLDLLEAAEKAANEILARVSNENIAMLANLPGINDQIPEEYDRRLIACAAKYAGRRFIGDETRQIRGVFIRRVHELANR